jgi:hypothetical protein
MSITPQLNQHHQLPSSSTTILRSTTQQLTYRRSKSLSSIIDNDGYVVFNWNRSPVVLVFGREQAIYLFNVVYVKYYFKQGAFAVWILFMLWIISLFSLIPGEVGLASVIVAMILTQLHSFMLCDWEIVKKLLLTNFTVMSTLILGIIFGLMMGFIFNFDYRGISSTIWMVNAMVWTLCTDAHSNLMRKRDLFATHVSSVIGYIIFTILLNFGLFPNQVFPSQVTFVTFSSIGKFPLTIDAYSVLNQCVTTIILLELNFITQAWKGELALARLTLQGRDEKHNNNDEQQQQQQQADGGDDLEESPDWEGMWKVC